MKFVLHFKQDGTSDAIEPIFYPLLFIQLLRSIVINIQDYNN